MWLIWHTMLLVLDLQGDIGLWTIFYIVCTQIKLEKDVLPSKMNGCWLYVASRIKSWKNGNSCFYVINQWDIEVGGGGVVYRAIPWTWKAFFKWENNAVKIVIFQHVVNVKTLEKCELWFKMNLCILKNHI